MPFNTYNEGLKHASDLATRAIAAESAATRTSPTSASAPASSPPSASAPSSSAPPPPPPTLLPALQRAFTLYLSAASSYSHLLASRLVPPHERAAVQRKWRLVLDRADKVKRRIETLGGRVGAVLVDDAGEEAAVLRRGGRLGGALTSTSGGSASPGGAGFTAEPWRADAPPPDRDFGGARWADGQQPELAPEQAAMRPEWAEVGGGAWDADDGADWRVRQGPGADCSVTAGIGSCLAHNRRWGTTLVQDSLYPQAISGLPRRSENAKHVVKLLLNGCWRSVVVDSLLPRAQGSGAPLHITAYDARQPPSSTSPTAIGPAWIPIAVKAYFKALGGYSIPGSNPAPDVYAFTGWIPERLELHSGFRREKEWARVYAAWQRGSVVVTLGSGPQRSPARAVGDGEGDGEYEDGAGLVPLHAYGVLDIREEGGERLLEVFDPGSTKARRHSDAEVATTHLTDSRAAADTITMSWDEVCSRFETLNLNWDPALLPVTAVRHWSWPKPSDDKDADGTSGGAETSEALALRSAPRYRVSATASNPGAEVWLLLSQHQSSAKDTALDDVALHVFRDVAGGSGSGSGTGPGSGSGAGGGGAPRLLQPAHQETNPYANAVQTLVRFPLRRGVNVLNAVAARDRGTAQTGFTLRAFASAGVELDVARVSVTLPFGETVSSALTKRSAGGHPGQATHHRNPQYKLVLGDAATPRSARASLRFCLQGARDLAWNVKLVWGQGARVFELGAEGIIASSGAFSYGMAFCEVDGVERESLRAPAAGTYTVVVSSYEPGVLGAYALSVESSSPLSLTPIPQEGAGMYARAVASSWTEATAGGRPSSGTYALNPRIELTLPTPGSIQARLTVTHNDDEGDAHVPVNLTLFRRAEGGGLGEQVATSGPYEDRVSGVSIGRVRVGSGVYWAVPSCYHSGVCGRWGVEVWGDVAFSCMLEEREGA